MSDSHPLSTSGNYLLRSLSAEDAELIEPSLEPLDLPRGHVVSRPNLPTEHVYFLSSGIISLLAYAGRLRRSEVGIIGREGMSGLAVVLGVDRSPFEGFMQVAGEGQRIDAVALREAMDVSQTLRLFLLGFVQTFLIQVAFTALANAQARLEERLCRWLLMCDDRVDGEKIGLTHEFLATMLGVRRAGVTTALHIVEGRGLIRSTRGKIEIRDREGIEICADRIYGTPEDQYRRLMGVDLTATRS